MDKATREFILKVMSNAKDLTLATVREDGYPQATTVGFANDGMTIYVSVGKDSQKAKNIRRSSKVSLTIDNDYEDWNHIKGLSMAAAAEILSDPQEIRHAGECLVKKFPQAAELVKSMPMDEIAMLKITPKVISVLDYEKGFGHTELVTV